MHDTVGKQLIRENYNPKVRDKIPRWSRRIAMIPLQVFTSALQF